MEATRWRDSETKDLYGGWGLAEFRGGMDLCGVYPADLGSLAFSICERCPMNTILAAIGNTIAGHAEGIGIGSVVLYTAFVTAMPETPPATFAEYWAWVRNALQASLPTHRVNPTQPK